MEVLFSKNQNCVCIEIRLAANHSIFLLPETAAKLAEDIVATLQAHSEELELKTEDQSNQISRDHISNSQPKLTSSPYQLIGVYKIDPTHASIHDAIKYHHDDFLLDDQGNFQDEVRWADFEGLVLVEAQVLGRFSPNDLGAISQGDQAPYMEYYLDANGQKLLTESEASDIPNPRVCFFLHFVNIEKPLKIGSQTLLLPTITELPERLMPFTHYIPVD